MSETRTPRDPTVVAVPLYFATMAAEHAWTRRRAASTAGRYERRDTVTSLTMGVLSLVAPLVGPRVLRPLTPGRGRWGRAVVAGAVAAAVATTAADRAVRRSREGGAPTARRVARVGGVVSVSLGLVAVATTWQSRTSLHRMWRRRPHHGPGPLQLLGAVAGWDFIYYWNHRLMHECRYMWAVHVVHHSSERYNLSTALRQPVLDAVGTPLPYGVLCLAGISPAQVELARGINLLYQYWIHTETVGHLGRMEAGLNSPSHHRVHHGSNRAYIDRNHVSILIVWDRLFGTFQREEEPAVYGLTRNVGSYNPAVVATHEFRAILSDVAASDNWRDRLGFVVRGPGWADRRRTAVATSAMGTGPMRASARSRPRHVTDSIKEMRP